jgi:hypothetical protein
VVCEERVGSLWGIIGVWRFVSEGDGEGYFGFEARYAVLHRENVFCIRLAPGPDEDDGRDASSRLGIPVSVFYEVKVYICGIILVLDGPRDDVGRGQVGRVIDEGLDEFDGRASLI